MRICPRCGRENKARARFCDRCGFGFAAHLGGQPPTERAMPRPEVPAADSNPPSEGKGPGSGGVPAVRQSRRYSPTMKLGSPPDQPPLASDSETIKAPTANGAPAGPAVGSTAAPGSAPGLAPGTSVPEPDATISGAVFQRARDTGGAGGPLGTTGTVPGAAAGADHVGWLVVEGVADGPPSALWPLTAGVTLVGRDAEATRNGLVIDHAGLAPVHAFLFHRDGRTWFMDLSAPQGSFINDQRIPPFTGRELRDRDRLRLGDLALRFRSLTEPA